MIRFLGLLPVILGVMLVYFAVDKGLSTYAFIDRADELTGTIVRFDPVGDGTAGEDGKRAAVIRYHGPDGREMQMLGPPVRWRDQLIGTPVHLLALPGHADKARINEIVSLWAPAVLKGIGGLLVVLIGIGILTMERRHPERRPLLPLWARLGLLAVALVVLALAWNDYSATVDAVDRYPRVRGIVTANVSGHPQVRYSLPDGTPFEAVDLTASATVYRPGDVVTVTYPSDGRDNAQIERFDAVWGGTATLGTVGGILFLAFLFLSSLTRKVPVLTRTERRVAARTARAARAARRRATAEQRNEGLGTRDEGDPQTPPSPADEPAMAARTRRPPIDP